MGPHERSRPVQDLWLLNAFRHQRFPHLFCGGGDAAVPLLCSTPFGIRGSRIGEAMIAFPSVPTLLNAFRHQRFPHSSVPRRARRARSDAAQRLSASEVPALLAGGRPSRTARWLLNAFRHQRFPHVREFVPRQAAQPEQTAQRLSASEVPAFEHSATGQRCDGGCSTPFGIRGSRIPLRPIHQASHIAAQRLSASEVPALGEVEVPPRSSRNCSTPFGIRGSRIFAAKKMVSASHAAQRLSASEVPAFIGAVVDVNCPQSLLNAFRHQRFPHCGMPCTRKEIALTCSTPFGIRGSRM